MADIDDRWSRRDTGLVLAATLVFLIVLPVATWLLMPYEDYWQ